jgi:chitin disaccharide deacetylase
VSSTLRRLIVNADDFGQCAGITRGIIETIERGLVTSTSLIVRGTDVDGAVAYARRHPALSVGLHVDLGEWTYRDGGWDPIYLVTDLDDERAVRAEIERQLVRFVDLLGSAPSHLDFHQHIHRREPVLSVAVDIAARLGVPLRHFSGVEYCGGFYGRTTEGTPLPDLITPEALVRVIHGLPDGVSELSCHPGFDVDFDTVYREERAMEAATLCDPRVLAAPADAGVELWSFHDLARATTSVSGRFDEESRR